MCQNRNYCVFVLKGLVLKHLNPFSVKASPVLTKHEEQLDNAVVRSTGKIGNVIIVTLLL